MEVETTQGGLGLTFANISTALDASAHPMAKSGCDTTYGLGSWSGDSEVWFLTCPDRKQSRPMEYMVLGVYDPRPQRFD